MNEFSIHEKECWQIQKIDDQNKVKALKDQTCG